MGRNSIPVCSACGEKTIRDTSGAWFCIKCADEWLRQRLDAKVRDHSIGGVILPSRVVDERRERASFRDIYPNRAARRRARGAA